MIWFILAFFLIPNTVLAQSSSVKITNFSSNSAPEWVEIHNETLNNIDLTNWAIGDSIISSPYDIILSGCLSPNSYLTFTHDSGWLNDGGDVIQLFDASRNLIDTYTYTSGRYGTDSRSDSNCQAPTTVPTIAPTTAPTTPPTQVPTTVPTVASTPTLPPLNFQISSVPSTVAQNEEFSLTFSAQNLTTGKEYYFKAYGGTVDNYGFETKNNSSWYEYNSTAANFPKFSPNTNTINQTLTVRAKTGKPLGSALIRLAIKEVVSGDWIPASNEKSINITAAPTPTLTPTQTPSPTPTKTPTPTPTRSPTSTPLPSLVLPTAIPTLDESDMTITVMPTIDLNVYGGATSPPETILGDIVISSPTPVSRFRLVSVSSAMPYLIIGVGSILLLGPLMLSKYLK
ncbi:MAG: lamin tail domain-containing protein [Candidatus Shapirobacteria bacterium]